MATVTAPIISNESRQIRRGITLWHVSVGLIVLALAISGYLSYIKLSNQQMACLADNSVFDCAKVETSQWATFAGVPTAVLGFITYSIIFTILMLEKVVPVLREYGVMIVLGIVAFAFVYHCFLTLMAFTRIGALCPWCLGAHATITVLLIVTLFRLRNNLRPV